MLFLTDAGPINCDNDAHGVRDMRTGRPPMTPAQLARDDKRLIAMVRNWAASKRRHAHDFRSTKDKPMPRFNSAALFQRPESRSGEAFSDYIAELKMRPLDLWKKRLRDASRRVSGHAFDSGPDHEEALKHLQRMEDHISARGDTNEFDPVYLAQCFSSMLKAMGTGNEEDAEDDDPTAPRRTPEDDMTAEERTRAQTGDRRRAKDGVGETPPESVVRPASRKIDHRRDFADIEQGGADSAYGFDADRLFQRGER